MPRLLPASSFALGVIVAGSVAAAPVRAAQFIDKDRVVGHEVLPPDPNLVDQAFTFEDPSFSKLPNSVAHSQDTIASLGPWQFVGYWDEHRRLAVARRRLPGGQWESFAFDDYKILGEDGHNAVSIGIAAGDGTLHLAFDHHSHPLNHRRSVPGLALDPYAFEWGPASFGPVVDTLDPELGVVEPITYPTFVPTPDGDLQLAYRQFGSGNGRMRLVDYDAQTGTWSGDHVFIERTGAHTDPLGGASASRNPYINRLHYDAEGTLHATWTWREKAPAVYNRDVCYAYSEDGGRTWYSSTDELVADADTGLAIDAGSPGVTGVPLGAGWGLMNNQGHAVDGRGRVHVVMYHKIEPATVVSYGNVWNSRYFHYWRDADQIWRSSMLAPTIGNRPKLFQDHRDNLFLAYQRSGDVHLEFATSRADYQDWVTLAVIPGDFGSSVQGDFAAFETHGILTLILQEKPARQGQDSALRTIDLEMQYDESCGAVDEVCVTSHVLATERDTYVRGGPHAEDTYGDQTVVAVQGAASDEDRRLGFHRFHLVDLLDRGPLTEAVLRLPVAAAGANWAAMTVEARRCALDTWGEYTTHWNNRPLPDEPPYAGSGGGTVLTIDVTQAVADELAGGGGRITFELAGLETDPDSWVDLHAREAGTALEATLVVSQANSLEPEADTYARSGAWADTNYGDVDRLIVKEDDAVDFDRVAYLRFDLAPLEGTGTIERVFLVAQAPTLGALARTTPYHAHAVDDDAWDELGLTWNDRPDLGAPQAAHFGRDELRWDVTDLALAELAGDGLLSLALRSDRAGAQRIVHLWSRESPLTDRRPRLELRYSSAGSQ